MKTCLFAGLMTALLAVAAFAQTRPGSISGVINSAAGAAIPRAQVTIRNHGAGAVKVVRADERGAFTVDGLAQGEYEATAETDGFRSQSQRVTLGPDGRITLDFSLEPQTESKEAGEDAGGSGEPGTSFVSQEWKVGGNLTSIYNWVPFNLGGSISYRSSYNPNGILITTKNEYVEDKNGMATRLGNAIRAAKPDGQR